jgi:hypothetical protein
VGAGYASLVDGEAATWIERGIESVVVLQELG